MLSPDRRKVNHTGKRREDHYTRHDFHRFILTSVQLFSEAPAALFGAALSKASHPQK
jgi:hypothetical protein